jgi:hypothetical protein
MECLQLRRLLNLNWDPQVYKEHFCRNCGRRHDMIIFLNARQALKREKNNFLVASDEFANDQSIWSKNVQSDQLSCYAVLRGLEPAGHKVSMFGENPVQKLNSRCDIREKRATIMPMQYRNTTQTYRTNRTNRTPWMTRMTQYPSQKYM